MIPTRPDETPEKSTTLWVRNHSPTTEAWHKNCTQGAVLRSLQAPQAVEICGTKKPAKMCITTQPQKDELTELGYHVESFRSRGEHRGHRCHLIERKQDEQRLSMLLILRIYTMEAHFCLQTHRLIVLLCN